MAFAPLEFPTPPPGGFKAYLFDCDGTIADSMPLQYQAWCKALSEWNCEFPEDLFYAWGGIPVEKIIEMLNEKHGLKMPPTLVTHQRENAYLAIIKEIGPVPEVVKFIHEQQGKIPLAVVSGSPRNSVIQTLTFLNLQDCFNSILGSEDYPRGKPYPDPYLLAAQKLGVAPEYCLVFEDAELGIQAAIAAGMGWVRVKRLG